MTVNDSITLTSWPPPRDEELSKFFVERVKSRANQRIPEATFGRWFERIQKLHISVSELLDRASHNLDSILSVPQQEAIV